MLPQEPHMTTKTPMKLLSVHIPTQLLRQLCPQKTSNLCDFVYHFITLDAEKAYKECSDKTPHRKKFSRWKSAVEIVAKWMGDDIMKNEPSANGGGTVITAWKQELHSNIANTVRDMKQYMDSNATIVPKHLSITYILAHKKNFWKSKQKQKHHRIG